MSPAHLTLRRHPHRFPGLRLLIGLLACAGLAAPAGSPQVSAAAPVAGTGVTNATPASWQLGKVDSLSLPRATHQVTPLSGGSLLLSGGCSGPSCSPAERTAELWDPRTRRFAPTGSMHEARLAHVAAPLANGEALVAGGWDGQRTLQSAERFDPLARQFRSTGALAEARMDATATVLKDASVLVIGGASATNRPLASAERYDTASGRFQPAGALSLPRSNHAATLLKDGRVLVTGGLVARNQGTAAVEIYDPASGRFSPAGEMRQARCKHAAVALNDGRVLVIAGSPDCNERRRIAETEIFDPRSGRFTAGPRLLNPRYKIVGATTVLPGGEVVVAGDASDVEIWVPGTPNFVKVNGSLGRALAFSTATTLPDGSVLVTGGYDQNIRATSDAWLLRAQRPPA